MSKREPYTGPKRCSACHSTAPWHVAYVESHGLCVV